jgi:predicted alpha-1,2-mannosidase
MVLRRNQVVKKKIGAALGLALLAHVVWAGPSQWVDPFIGTGGGGNTFPGALVPWGMVSVSPHNDPQAPSGYAYGRPFLSGFGHVHLSGTGCPDLGNVLVLPTVGDIRLHPEERRSAYDSEKASPGYYAVHLKENGIQAEMTATCRSGMSRYFFPERKGDANILIDAGHRLTRDPDDIKPAFESWVRLVSPSEVEGSSQSGHFCSPYAGNKQTVYFVAKFSKAAAASGTWKDGKGTEGREQKGSRVGAYFRFSTAGEESIVMKVGLSYVSVKNARLNLEAEMPGWDFEAVRLAASKAWDEELSKIKIKTSNVQQLKIFYTALYHCLIHPNVFSDVNGDYRGMGRPDSIKNSPVTRYTVFSLWDTYRNLHPLLTLVYPERQQEMVKSMLEMAGEKGLLPKWELAGNETGVMVGAPAIPVIADTYFKGVKGFDAEEAYEAMKRSLNPKGNKVYVGLKSLLKYGYIPKDDYQGDWVWGSVSTTQEYALAFWNLAQMAAALNKKEEAEAWMPLSGAYRNFYDPSTGFLQARNQDGSWITPFDPLAKCCDGSWPDSGGPGFVEGNAWQYLFFAPQDMDGMIHLLGGPEVFVKRLQQCFEEGQYDPYNEPDLSWPYLFTFVPREAWRTQKEVRRLMDRYYKTTPDGIPGNDDAGTMSAWYVFSALGFYPVCPGNPSYQVGSPLFQQVDVKMNQSFYPGRWLVLKTVNNSPEHPYVRSILVNGISYQNKFIRHESLVSGKTLVFQMDSQPAR